MKKQLLWAALCCIWSLVVAAQPGMGKIDGRVTDSSGASIAWSSLRLLNTGHQARSVDKGMFTFDRIPSGRYTLAAAAEGYADILLDIRVEEGRTTSLEIRMQRPWLSLEDVTVSADRREAREAVTPASITSFSTRELSQYRLWDLKDLSSLVPGLYSANPGDGRNVTSIRGIGTTSYDPAVVTYIDGVCQFNLDTYIPQLIDAERIEILRGPQGTLFGRNAMGGVIQVTTRRPGNRTRVGLESSSGNYGQRRTTATIRTPILKDKLFAGMALQDQARQGYHTNLFTGAGFDGMRQRSLNFDLRYAAGGAWTAMLNLKAQRTENEGAFPLAGSADAAFDNPYVLDQNATATMRDRGVNTSLSVSRSGQKVRLDMQTAWQMNHRVYDRPLDGDFSRADIVSIFNNYGDRFNRVSVWTQEIRLSSAPSSQSKLQWVSGMFLFAQDNPVKQATVFGKDAGLFGIPDKNFSLISQNLGKGSGIAFFGHGTYALTDRISFTAGMRYDREWRQLQVRGEYEKGSAVRFVTRPDTSARTAFGALSPKLGMQFELEGGRFAYLSYNRGFRAGGLTTLGSDPSQPPLVAFKPEYSHNLEAGLKGETKDGRISYRLASFYTIVDNAQVPTLILPDAVTVTRNAGRMRSLGAEVELEARVWKGFSLSSRGGVTNARYTKLTMGDNGRQKDLSGNRQIFTPTHTFLLAADYVKAMGKRERWRWEARMEGIHTGSQFFDLANQLGQGAYLLLNTRVGLSTGRWGLYAWGRNLSGRSYISYGYDFGAVHLGDPRTWGLTLSRNG